MKKLAIVILCLALVFSLAGCTGKDRPRPEDNTSPPGAVQPQPDSGNGERIADEKARLWVESCKYIEGIYTFNTGDKTYIMAALGEMPTAGYKVEIKKAAETAEEIKFDVEVEEPVGPAVEVITYPYALIEIEKTDKKLNIDSKGKIENRTLYPPANEHFIITNMRPTDVVEKEFEIKGFARAFEGSFRITLEDGHDVLIDTYAQADKAAPEWGEFSVKIKYENPTNPVGIIMLFEESAKDGSPTHQIMFPVSFMEFIK